MQRLAIVLSELVEASPAGMPGRDAMRLAPAADRREEHAAPAGSDTQKLGTLYRACMDENAIEAAGTAPIAPLLGGIGAVGDVPALATAIAQLQTAGVSDGLDVATQLRNLGDDPAAATSQADAVLTLETSLASATPSRAELRNRKATYHPTTLADLAKMAPHIACRRSSRSSRRRVSIGPISTSRLS